MKKEIQEEILSVLDNQIEIEIDAMGDFYTDAEIAVEVLLGVKNGAVILNKTI